VYSLVSYDRLITVGLFRLMIASPVADILRPS